MFFAGTIVGAFIIILYPIKEVKKIQEIKRVRSGKLKPKSHTDLDAWKMENDDSVL